MTQITNWTHSRAQRRAKILRRDLKATTGSMIRQQSGLGVPTGINSAESVLNVSVDAHDLGTNSNILTTACNPLVAYSGDHQIACCQSLCSLGFGDISLNRIEKYINSAHSWLDHLQAFTLDAECELFFPNNTLTMAAIGELARFHDSAIRSPESTLTVEDLPTTIDAYKSAKQDSREIATRLTFHSYWLDTASLPLTAKTLKQLDALCLGPNQTTDATSHDAAVAWLTAYLTPAGDLATHIACGNVAKLRLAVKQALDFTQCSAYQRVLGKKFKGLYSQWAKLQTTISFYADIGRILHPAGTDREVLESWDRYERNFYSLSRKASTVRRRLHKLNRLVKRQYFTPVEPTGYYALAQKSIARLQSWHTVLENCPGRGDLTPEQLMKNLKAPDFKILGLSTIN